MEIPYLKSLPSLIEAIKLNYEAFILGTPELDHAGIFHDNKEIYAVVRNKSETGMPLKEISEIYDKNYRTMSIPGLKFVEEVACDFIRIPLRTTTERINLFGHAFNRSDLENQISTALPEELHPFNVSISWASNLFRFKFNKHVSDEVFEEVILICESLGYYGYTYSKEIDQSFNRKTSNVNFLKNRTVNLTLLSSKYLKGSMPTEIIKNMRKMKTSGVKGSSKYFLILRWIARTVCRSLSVLTGMLVL